SLHERRQHGRRAPPAQAPARAAGAEHERREGVAGPAAAQEGRGGLVSAAAERSVAAPVYMDDEQLAHWAYVYLRLNLLERGFTFEQFLVAPLAVRESAARLARLAEGFPVVKFRAALPREYPLSSKE